MARYVPYEKRSKKQKRQIDSAKRGSWGVCNPVTRKPERPDAYNRKKALRWKKDPYAGFYFTLANRFATFYQFPSNYCKARCNDKAGRITPTTPR